MTKILFVRICVCLIGCNTNVKKHEEYDINGTNPLKNKTVYKLVCTKIPNAPDELLLEFYKNTFILVWLHRIAKRHVGTKAETALVESKNSLIRHYLARFNRRTKRYSKALDMIAHSLLMLFNKNLLLTILI